MGPQSLRITFIKSVSFLHHHSSRREHLHPRGITPTPSCPRPGLRGLKANTKGTGNTAKGGLILGPGEGTSPAPSLWEAHSAFHLRSRSLVQPGGSLEIIVTFHRQHGAASQPHCTSITHCRPGGDTHLAYVPGYHGEQSTEGSIP